ncbi:MAG: porin [Haliea sp.]|jgi:hypothetical protein|nr:porin [Haliea sp.]
MLKKTAIAAGLGLILSSAAQAEYQFEVGANSGTGDVDLGPVSADQDFIGLSGAYYLQSVDTSKGPLSEAAFLDRASSIQLAASMGEIDADNAGDADVDTYAAGTRLVHKESGWLVDLGYRFDEIDPDNLEKEEIDTYSIGAGKYVLENTAVVLSYSNIDSDLEGDSDAYDLGVEHLWMFDTGALKLDANIGRIDLDDSDDVDVWGLGGTYYVNDRLGFGTAYEQEDSDNTDLESWSLFAEWFVTENVALALAYTEQEDQDIDLETDAFMFRADVRF